MQKPFFHLLKGAIILAPENLGQQDLLIAGNKIIAIGKDLALPDVCKGCEIDLQGYFITPGFVDSHVHLIGGGGEAGYHSRTPEVLLSKVTTNGITTVVGCLGTDGVTRHMESLLAKARGLEIEGISSYIYTGSYEIPTPTITGNVRKDIIIIDKVIGAGEIALSDHRSSQPSLLDFQKLAAEARVGGILSNKAGVIDVHLGDGKTGLGFLKEIVKNTEIPPTQFIPTHVNRNPKLFEESLEWAKQGGYMDVTSGVNPASGATKSLKPSTAVKIALEKGVPLENILMSSDGNGSMPLFDDNGVIQGLLVASLDSLWDETRDMVLQEGIKLEDAIKVITSNVAKALKLYPTKGCLHVLADADIVALDKDLKVQHVWAKGQHMVEKGQPIVLGTFE